MLLLEFKKILSDQAYAAPGVLDIRLVDLKPFGQNECELGFEDVQNLVLLLNQRWYYLLYWFTATATAKSLQSCPTLCDPIDGAVIINATDWVA